MGHLLSHVLKTTALMVGPPSSEEQTGLEHLSHRSRWAWVPFSQGVEVGRQFGLPKSFLLLLAWHLLLLAMHLFLIASCLSV